MDKTKARLQNGITFYQTMVVLRGKYDSENLRKTLPTFLALVEQYIKETDEVINNFFAPNEKK